MDPDFILATASLARAAPENWKTFLTHFRRYADAKRDACVQAPLDKLQVSQGHAQAIAYLSKEFETVVAKADALTRK